MVPAPRSFASPSPGLSRSGAGLPSSFVEELARRQWDSLKKSKASRAASSSRDSTPSQLTPAQAAAELRKRMHETKHQRSRSRDRASENLDGNVRRGRPGSRQGGSSIMAAAERKWEELDGNSHRAHGRGRELEREPERGHEPPIPTPRSDSLERTSLARNSSRRDRGDSKERDDKSASTQSELPQHIVTVLVQVCGARGTAQEKASETMRDLVHDRKTAKVVAEEDWALEALARPLIDGSERAQVACAACFRHLALDSGGSTRMLQSPLILTALVTALGHGADDTRQKAAAALGNLAWRSEASREIIMGTAGVMDGLMLLLRFGPPPGRESALAALSNLTLNQRCTSELCRAPEALSELVGEMLTGSAKGQLRAAGIMRNMAGKPENCQPLMAFPGVLPVLQRLADECAHAETQQRAAKALTLMLEPVDGPSKIVLNRGGTSSRARTPRSMSRSSSPVASATSPPGRPNGTGSSPPASAPLVGRGGSGVPGFPVNSFSCRSTPNGKEGSGSVAVELGSVGKGVRRKSVETVVRRKNIETDVSLVASMSSAADSAKVIISSTSGRSSPSSPTCSSSALLSSDEHASPRHEWHAQMNGVLGQGGEEHQAGAEGEEVAGETERGGHGRSGASGLLATLLGNLSPSGQDGGESLARRSIGSVESKLEESKAVDQVMPWIAANCCTRACIMKYLIHVCDTAESNM